MATSKTLAPTNVTISIPAMTDQPNASVLANCADKEADAINALNSQIPRWMEASRTGVTQAPGSNYWAMTTAFPAKSGFSRRVLYMETNNANVIVVRCSVNGDGTVTVYTYNLSDSNQTFNISGIYGYLADASKDT